MYQMYLGQVECNRLDWKSLTAHGSDLMNCQSEPAQLMTLQMCLDPVEYSRLEQMNLMEHKRDSKNQQCEMEPQKRDLSEQVSWKTYETCSEQAEHNNLEQMKSTTRELKLGSWYELVPLTMLQVSFAQVERNVPDLKNYQQGYVPQMMSLQYYDLVDRQDLRLPSKMSMGQEEDKRELFSRMKWLEWMLQESMEMVGWSSRMMAVL